VSLAAGVYDLAVVGEDGNAVIGFEAVEAKPIASNQTSRAAHLVSLQNTINTLNIELAEPIEIDQAAEEVPTPIVQEVGMFDQPFIGGGFPTRGVSVVVLAEALEEAELPVEAASAVCWALPAWQ
jgi:hypothetical protein